MTLTALAILGVAAGLVPLIQRDLRRAVERQKLRTWLRCNPRVLEMQQRFADLQHQVGQALLPAMREMAATFARFTEAANRRGDA